MIRVACTGGRDYNDQARVFRILDRLLSIRKDFVVVVGDAKGADNLVRQWCKVRNVPVEVFYADWKKHGLGAGPIRNKEMLESGLDMLIAFPGGKGTQNMISICKKVGIVVIDLNS